MQQTQSFKYEFCCQVLGVHIVESFLTLHLHCPVFLLQSGLKFLSAGHEQGPMCQMLFWIKSLFQK